MKRLQGLIAATFTPLNGKGDVDTGFLPELVDALITQGVQGLYVCGSTGEGPLLTAQERRSVAKAYIDAAAGRIPVAIQVGHESLREAQALAAHAQESGADAISAVPPSYFKPDGAARLLDCMAMVAEGAPELPFYYYHIPLLSGTVVDMEQFTLDAAKRMPTFAGIKFSSPRVDELQACKRIEDGRYHMLFGVDEMHLSGIAAGADGAVGSTYNVIAPIYRKSLDAYTAGDMAEANRLQIQAVGIVRVMIRHGGLPAIKSCMKFLGWDCGPSRLPLRALTDEEETALRKELDSEGFFDWAVAR